jgi:hypothetical protein
VHEQLVSVCIRTYLFLRSLNRCGAMTRPQKETGSPERQDRRLQGEVQKQLHEAFLAPMRRYLRFQRYEVGFHKAASHLPRPCPYYPTDGSECGRSEHSMPTSNLWTWSAQGIFPKIFPLESSWILPPEVILYECLTDDNIAEQDLLLTGSVT